MKNKYLKLITKSLFLIICICCLIAELNALSSFLTGTLLFFYIWLPITILLLAIAIIKLINVVQSIRKDTELSKEQKRREQILNILISFLISLAIILTVGYSMYQLNHKIYKPYREVLNTSYFTEYIEDENSKYNTGLMNTASLFEETDTTISKMVFIDDTNHQIIIEGCHIETKSVLLKNLKYSLVKMKLMGNKDFVEKDGCVYFYDPGIYDGLIRYSKIIVITKGESGFVYAIVETSTPDVPIDIDKTLKSCNELVS